MRGWRAVGLEFVRTGFSLGPISFEVGDGEATVIVGPNGAGKSTLLRLLAGLEGRSAGRFERDGVDLAERPPEGRGLGYIPPGLALFPHRTVLGNVAYPGELRGVSGAAAAARALLDRFGLLPLAGRYPRTLSGGEQQRVAVARALATSPELLLWDEPVAALDVGTRHALHETLRILREEDRIPLLFVTHDPSDAFGVADRFLRLEGGRAVRSGRMEEFGGHPRTAFDARFLGYANVLPREELVAGLGPVARWLSERSGPGGVAFSARSLSIRPEGRFEGRVVRLEPRADATGVRLNSEGTDLWGEVPPGGATAGPWGRGSPARFDLEEAALWPLDSWGGGAEP